MDDDLDTLRSAVGRHHGVARTRPLVELGVALADRYRRAGPGQPAARTLLDEAIVVLDEAYDHLEPGEFPRGQVAGQLGWLLGIRHIAHGGPPPDRDTGIGLLEEALELPRLPQIQRAITRLTLGQLLMSRVTAAMQSGGLFPDAMGSTIGTTDADRAVDHFRQILDGPVTSAEITAAAETLLGIAEAMQTLTGGGLGFGQVMRTLGALQELQHQEGTDVLSAVLGPVPNPFEMNDTRVGPLERPVVVDRSAPTGRGLPDDSPSPTARARREPAAIARPSGRIVSTGLSLPAQPTRNLPSTRAVAPETDLLFWLAVGAAPAPDAIDDRTIPLDLPEGTPVGAPITVALFGFPGEIEIRPDADIGELVLRRDGAVEVLRQPGPYPGDRLLFPIRTPSGAGRHRLRCNVYCRQTLLQSRLVEIDVDPDPRYRAGVGLRSTTDYVVDTALDAGELDALAPITLSVLINDNDSGSHGFRFLGSGGTTPITADVVLDAADLQDDIARARRALQNVSWDGGGDWDGSARFRYDGRTEKGFAGDLIELARAGYRLWTTICGPVARERQASGEAGSRLLALQELMRAPGTVEFATKFSARLVVPAALFYDFDLDTGDPAALSVCDVALDAIARGADLAERPCFRGDCPNAGPIPGHIRTTAERRVVCPGGFWGFRHEIGLPQSVRAGSVAQPPSDPPTGAPGRIAVAGLPHVVVAVASDFSRNPHPASVAERGDSGSRPVVEERGTLLDLLRGGTPPHLVYLFCHGLVSDTGLPGLRVGGDDSAPISPDGLADMFWETHPLVILNGCRTTAVEPRYAMNFVDVLVRDAAASGVVGTEVITHEGLAATFADLLLDGWMRPGAGMGIGAAMRRARLGLLAQGNPLGMVYVAYAAPQLRLIPTP